LVKKIGQNNWSKKFVIILTILNTYHRYTYHRYTYHRYTYHRYLQGTSRNFKEPQDSLNSVSDPILSEVIWVLRSSVCSNATHSIGELKNLKEHSFEGICFASIPGKGVEVGIPIPQQFSFLWNSGNRGMAICHSSRIWEIKTYSPGFEFKVRGYFGEYWFQT